LIAGGVSLLVVLLILFLLVLPRKSAISSANSSLDSAKQMTVTLNQQIAQLTQIQSKAPQYQNAENTFKTYIPPTADEPGLIRYMQFVTEKTGGVLSSVTFGPPAAPTASTSSTSSSGGYSTMSLAITFASDPATATDPTLAYREISYFIYQVMNLPRLVTVTNVSVTGSWGTPYTATITGETFTTAQPSTAAGG
jgi:Tfp pilus assembly protein PilO